MGIIKKMKYVLYPLSLVFLLLTLVSTGYSGLEDRSSDVTLRKAPHNQVVLPDVATPSEVLTDTPATGIHWVYNDDGVVIGKNTNGVITPISTANRIPIPLASVFVDGTGPITSTSAPNLTTMDSVGAIVWDDSGETAEIQFPWYPSADYTGLVVNLLCSSSNASGIDNIIDWGIFIHENDVGFPSITDQDAVTLTSTTLDQSLELVRLELNSTGIAAITAADTDPSGIGVTIAVWNASTDDYTLEIKKIWLYEY